METIITITQVLTDGKTANLVDITPYTGSSGGFATAILKNTQDDIISITDIPNSASEVIVAADLSYIVNINGSPVGSGTFPYKGNAIININAN